MSELFSILIFGVLLLAIAKQARIDQKIACVIFMNYALHILLTFIQHFYLMENEGTFVYWNFGMTDYVRYIISAEQVINDQVDNLVFFHDIFDDHLFISNVYTYILAGLFYITGVNVLIAKIFNAFLWSLGIIFLYRFIFKNEGKKTSLTTGIFLLMYPEFYFWFDFPGKETTVTFILILLFYSWDEFVTTRSVKHLVILIGSFTVLVFLRVFYAYLVIFSGVGWYLLRERRGPVFLKILIAAGFLCVSALILNSFSELLGLTRGKISTYQEEALGRGYGFRGALESMSYADILALTYSNPFVFLQTLGFGTANFFLEPIDWLSTSNFTFYPFLLHVGMPFWYLILPFLVSGCYLFLKQKRSEVAYPLVIFVVMVVGIMSLFGNYNTRVRITLMPFFLFWAVMGMREIRETPLILLAGYFLLCIGIASYVADPWIGKALALIFTGIAFFMSMGGINQEDQGIGKFLRWRVPPKGENW